MIYKEKILIEGIDKEIYIFSFKNENNIQVKITNYGGVILEALTPNRDGIYEDIVLGYENLKDYTTTETYFGAIVGRYANRIANGKIIIEDKEYNLYKNNGNNNLHGGKIGYDKVVWNSEVMKDEKGEFLQLTYLSQDGEEGFPGNVENKVLYRLTEENELVIEYFATTDKTTIVNLTNHSYFNLSGHASGDILDNKVKIYGDKITVVNDESIPTGEIRNTKNTPMDFTEFKAVGKDIESDYEQIRFAAGYDHNWIIDGELKALKKAAEVIDEKSGRKLEVYTTKPGIQFYTGNFLGQHLIGKGNTKYVKRAGLCIEAQYYPDSLNHKAFPSPLLKVGEEYGHKTIYKFCTI